MENVFNINLPCEISKVQLKKTKKTKKIFQKQEKTDDNLEIKKITVFKKCIVIFISSTCFIFAQKKRKIIQYI